MNARRILPLLHIPIRASGRNRLRHRGDVAAINLQTHVRIRLARIGAQHTRGGSGLQGFSDQACTVSTHWKCESNIAPDQKESKKRGLGATV